MMTNRYLTIPIAIAAVFAMAAFCTSCSKEAMSVKTVTTPPADTGSGSGKVTYTQIWSDEFNGTQVDLSKWTMETGPGVNNEKENYQAANATEENGNLVITAKKETVGGYPYTSARMNTLNKFSNKFGRFEARIKIPLGQGLWPAFWAMGSDITTVSWPNCGEIDIMEHVNTDNLIYGTMHWNGGSGHVQYGDKLTITNPGDYHIYAVEWDTNYIKWYVDGTLFVTGKIAGGINNTAAFQQPFYMLLNLAVAGDFPGQTVDESLLPAKMYVDYVRVYKAN